MKGIIFNLLEEVVLRQYGADAWDDLLDAAEVSGSYTSLGNYSDEEMQKLVATAATTLKQTPADVLRWFGRQSMPILSERYPQFFAKHASARPFILSVNSIIHPEVRKLYAGAKCPFFHFHDEENGALRMGYQSSRKLCDLAHGFVEGAAAHYHEQVAVEHLSCMQRGDEQCMVEIQWQH